MEDRMDCQEECSQAENLTEKFRKFSVSIAKFAGTPVAFTISLFVIAIWAISGPFFRFSDTWQLVINTGTTIITFLMVFLIQNMQNRDAKAIHLKLDELIRAVKGARNNLVMLENLSEDELDQLEQQFSRIAERNRARQNGAATQETKRPENPAASPNGNGNFSQ